jgi:hypothetical protein
LASGCWLIALLCIFVVAFGQLFISRHSLTLDLIMNLIELSVTLLLAAVVSAKSLHPRTGKTHNGSSCKPRLPYDGKCWNDVRGLKWTAQGFDYHASYIFTNPAHQNSWGYVNFNLTNNVVPYTAVCKASSNQLTDFFYGTLDYNCTLPAEAPVGAAVKFRFSRPSGQLDIEEAIPCTENSKT